jgi:hypothetical protein
MIVAMCSRSARFRFGESPAPLSHFLVRPPNARRFQVATRTLRYELLRRDGFVELRAQLLVDRGDGGRRRKGLGVVGHARATGLD